MENLSDIYINYAETLSDINETEINLQNKKLLLQEYKTKLDAEKQKRAYATEITDHAFRQIMTRLAELANSNPVIKNDVYKSNPSESLTSPPGMMSFIISTLANANKKGYFKEEQSRHTEGGIEFHYSVDIKKWKVRFVAIVENNHIKTGFFNWT